MSNNLKNILSNSNKDIDNQQLMDYLSNQLSKTQQHDVEEAMNEDDFMNDAVEGLQQMKDSRYITAYVEQLNEELKRKVAKNKKRKDKRRLKDSPYTFLIIIILMVLLLISFVMVKKYMDSKKGQTISNTTAVKTLLHAPGNFSSQFKFKSAESI